MTGREQMLVRQIEIRDALISQLDRKVLYLEDVIRNLGVEVRTADAITAAAMTTLNEAGLELRWGSGRD